MSRKYLCSIIVLFGILVLAVMLKTPLISKAMMNILPGLRATKEPIDPYTAEIKAIEAELQRTDLSTDDRKFLMDKFSSTFLMATQRAEGKLHQPTRQLTIGATPTMEIAGFKLPDGIDDHPPVPFSESVFTAMNSWRKTTAERYYLVYAGIFTNDPKQGAVFILHADIYRFFQYNTPTKNGGVKVIKENGTIITLQSTDGTIFYFDASLEQFVDKNGKPIPASISASPTSSLIIDSTQSTIPAYP